MIIDKIDIDIIGIFYKLKPNEITNIYSITQNIFGDKDKYLLRKKYNLIKNRIQKLNNYGLININGADIKVFELQVQNIAYKKIKCSENMKNFIGLKVKNEWAFFEY